MFKRIGLLIFGAILAIGVSSCTKQKKVVITGRFIIESTGQPYTDFGFTHPIFFKGTQKFGKGVGSPVKRPGPDGRFRIPNVPASIKRIEFFSKNFVKREWLGPFDLTSITPTPLGDIDIGDIKLPLGHMVRVKVRGPTGEAVKLASLRLATEDPNWRDQDASTDVNGVFVFGGYSSGSAVLTVHAERDRGNDWVVGEGGIDTVTVDCEIKDEFLTEIEIRFPSQSQ
jgi:hypothetical protein